MSLMWKWQSQVRPWSLQDESLTTCAEAGATAGTNSMNAATASRTVILFIVPPPPVRAAFAVCTGGLRSNPGTNGHPRRGSGQGDVIGRQVQPLQRPVGHGNVTVRASGQLRSRFD